MYIFIKKFRGVEKGRIYPTAFDVNDAVPAELEGSAKAAKAAREISKSEFEKIQAAKEHVASETDGGGQTE